MKMIVGKKMIVEIKKDEKVWAGWGEKAVQNDKEV